jgi:thiol-disulfide isomerase/thioredoxin
MEAFIASMTSSGLAENRPPHIVLPSGLVDMTKPAFAALLALFLAACQPDGGTAADEAAAPADPARPADLKRFVTGQFDRLDLDKDDMVLPVSPFYDAEGKAHTFAEYKGKVVVYNIWAEWCAPCVEEMPSLARLQKAFAGKDVVVVPIAAGYPEAKESTRKKLASLVGTDLPFFYDDKFYVNSDAKTGNFPSTIIYDRDGKEAARLEFPATWDKPEAIALVQAVLDSGA